ncbi:hypothetical protein B9G55_01275 [Saccharibacillus sp. O16]|nr:hypothetical protein B9G55_01275 [Saccharibacillus sp. O16]
MKRFRWLRWDSRSAFVSSVATKMLIQEMTLEGAVARTLEQGRHAINGEAMPRRELRAIKREAEGLYQRARDKAKAETTRRTSNRIVHHAHVQPHRTKWTKETK